jgi:hypothetical protein
MEPNPQRFRASGEIFAPILQRCAQNLAMLGLGRTAARRFSERTNSTLMFRTVS